jgi:hypothetical protein
MTRLAVLVATAALVLATNALALGGSVYAQISANWNDSSNVLVTVLSNHSFNGGTVGIACTNPSLSLSQPLNGWTFDSLAHQYRINTSFNITAAGATPGDSCTITVTDGHKVLAQQSFVSV